MNEIFLSFIDVMNEKSVFSYIIILMYGLLLGSFLNVVSLRFNTGKSLNGRSMCFSCAKTLQWFELIPVVSWLIQKGRCRGCSSRISFELITTSFKDMFSSNKVMSST